MDFSYYYDFYSLAMIAITSILLFLVGAMFTYTHMDEVEPVFEKVLKAIGL